MRKYMCMLLCACVHVCSVSTVSPKVIAGGTANLHGVERETSLVLKLHTHVYAHSGY